MSDGRQTPDTVVGSCPGTFKSHPSQSATNTNRNTPAAQKQTSPGRTAGWTPRSFRAGRIKITPQQRVICPFPRDVFGRRRVTTLRHGDAR